MTVTALSDRLARVRLSAGALLALVLAGAMIALLSLAVAVVTFQRQAAVSQREARAAIAAAVAQGEQSRLQSCVFVEAFIPEPGDAGPAGDYGKRIEAAARALSASAQCP